MDIINNVTKITKKVGDGAMNIARKSSEIMEITRLNSSISAEEDKIEREFAKIGRILFEKYSAGEQLDSDLNERCSNVAILKNNISEYKQRILELKGIKYCPNCGLQLSLNIKYCPECGEKQEMPRIEIDNEESDTDETEKTMIMTEDIEDSHDTDEETEKED